MNTRRCPAVLMSTSRAARASSGVDMLRLLSELAPSSCRSGKKYLAGSGSRSGFGFGFGFRLTLGLRLGFGLALGLALGLDVLDFLCLCFSLQCTRMNGNEPFRWFEDTHHLVRVRVRVGFGSVFGFGFGLGLGLGLGSATGQHSPADRAQRRWLHSRAVRAQ